MPHSFCKRAEVLRRALFTHQKHLASDVARFLEAQTVFSLIYGKIKSHLPLSRNVSYSFKGNPSRKNFSFCGSFGKLFASESAQSLDVRGHIGK